MKIRNGFVSNSSSSSFIISNENFPTVRSLAIYMINKQIEDSIEEEYDGSSNLYSEDDKSWNQNYIKTNRKYIERLQDIDENQSISFPSCNYDTYIRKANDCYLVATCNNTRWELWGYTTKLTESAKEFLLKLKNDFTEGSDDLRRVENIIDFPTSEFYHFGKDYYDLDKEILGVELYEDCPNENREGHKYVNLWDTVKWGKICLICNPYYKRKDKLIVINDISCKQ